MLIETIQQSAKNSGRIHQLQCVENKNKGNIDGSK